MRSEEALAPIPRGLIPSCDGVALTHPKPRLGYRLAPKTVGDHLANKRVDLRVSQRGP